MISLEEISFGFHFEKFLYIDLSLGIFEKRIIHYICNKITLFSPTTMVVLLLLEKVFGEISYSVNGGCERQNIV